MITVVVFQGRIASPTYATPLISFHKYKEDPIELDSSLYLWNDIKGVA